MAEQVPFPIFPSLQKPGMDVADGYVTFVRHSQDMLREKVNEEVYIERLFDVSKPQHLFLHQREAQLWQDFIHSTYDHL